MFGSCSRELDSSLSHLFLRSEPHQLDVLECTGHVSTWGRSVTRGHRCSIPLSLCAGIRHSCTAPVTAMPCGCAVRVRALLLFRARRWSRGDNICGAAGSLKMGGRRETFQGRAQRGRRHTRAHLQQRGFWRGCRLCLWRASRLHSRQVRARDVVSGHPSGLVATCSLPQRPLDRG